MKIHNRDYNKKPTLEELEIYRKIRKSERIDGSILKKNKYFQYPEAIRHYKSLFPNNHIELYDCRKSGKMEILNKEFYDLIHNENTNERDILYFINHKPAFYIICGLFLYKEFGHHDAYIMPEFLIGYGKYRADYLLVGKSSGGYEFIFVELEAPNKRTTVKSGYEGENQRKGINQIRNWKAEIERNFVSISDEFKKYAKPKEKLSDEFLNYDNTRFHYAVVTGLRDDYNEVTYRNRREIAKDNGISLYHYDNLYDRACELIKKNTF